MFLPDGSLTIAQCATLACLLEATAPKPGNVHRSADFEDLCFADFVVSAAAVGPAIGNAEHQGVGAAILEAIRATRAFVPTNTNLGCVLLMAPLAAVPRSQSLQHGIPDVIQGLTHSDAKMVYEAIRMAAPGGLGQADEMDVRDDPPNSLVDAMRLAAGRDFVARQYANNFFEVLSCVTPWLVDARNMGWPMTTAIIHTHIRLMADFPDSLIARKCGEQVAQESSARAKHVLASGDPDTATYQQALHDFDFWLRCDGHRRNPGTSADLIAAGLFAALRDSMLVSPFR
ncbi:MAG: triphosphoribosyl-dephospho-CoA synthase [Planctomycetaceae bacterium]|nr:triphosphoribosyl-dephospho-CoA synthase [Planctomycetaceae bacterium]